MDFYFNSILKWTVLHPGLREHGNLKAYFEYWSLNHSAIWRTLELRIHGIWWGTRTEVDYWKACPRKSSHKAGGKLVLQSVDIIPFLRHSMANTQGTSEKIRGQENAKFEEMHMVVWGSE